MTEIKPEDIEVLSDHCDGYGGPALLFHNIPVQNRTIAEIESDLEKTKQQILQALQENPKLKADIEEYKKTGLAIIRGARTLPAERYLELETIEKKYIELKQRIQEFSDKWAKGETVSNSELQELLGEVKL